MMCKICGKNLVEEAAYCAFCGTKVMNKLGLVDKITYGATQGREYYTYFGDFTSRFASWYSSEFHQCHQSYAYYQNKFYYIKYGYLFESTSEGIVLRVIKQVADESCVDDIFVNESGIYLMGENRIVLIDFAGNEKAVIRTDDEIEWCYICDNRIFVIIYVSELDSYIAQWYDTDTHVMHHIYTAQPKILGVNSRGEKSVSKESLHYIMANSKRVVMWRQFVYYSYPENDDNIIELETAGWYSYDFETKQVTSLNSVNFAPHQVAETPQLFNEKWWDIEEKKEWVPIVYFDMKHDRMWVKKKIPDSCYGAEIWEPVNIGVASEENSIQDMCVWKIDKKPDSGRHYFDGRNRYYAKDYCSFEAYKENGETFTWNETGHGACDLFQVQGEYLFLDKEAYGEEQYELVCEKHQPIRKSWMLDKYTYNMSSDEKNAIGEYEYNKNFWE